MAPELILHNGKITTLAADKPEVSAIAVSGGKVSAIGTNDEVLALADHQTQKIDLNHRRVIPGLNDSHLHVIRAGLFYNLELRWDGVPSLSQALKQLKQQADVTPPPQWVRVIGGWNEFQFAEGRMPTLEEINKAAPNTPVFLLHLYDSALLNQTALRVLGFNRDTPNPPGGLIARDNRGNPTGLLIAEPSALILYSTIANAPKLSFEDQLNSTRHYLRELNRFGVTSVSDAGGGGQNYPEDYAVVKKLDDEGHLTVRIAYSLFAQKPGQELVDYTRWMDMTKPGEGSDLLRVNGGGRIWFGVLPTSKTSCSHGRNFAPSWNRSWRRSSRGWRKHNGRGEFMRPTTNRLVDSSTFSSEFIETTQSISFVGSLITPKQ